MMDAHNMKDKTLILKYVEIVSDDTHRNGGSQIRELIRMELAAELEKRGYPLDRNQLIEKVR